MVTSRPQAHHSSSSFGNSAAASTILGAFGRRPRTATNGRDRQGLPTDYSESTDDLQRTTSRNRLSLIARAGIPRSNSSSQVNRVPAQDNSGSISRFAFPSSTVDGGRASSSMAQNSTIGSNSNRPMSNGDAAPPFHTMNRTQSSQSNSGGSAFGRYFRRYSQGAGKNMAAALEARSMASGSMDNRGISQDITQAVMASSTTDGNMNSLHTSVINASAPSGSFMSASQTMPTLSSMRDADVPMQQASDFVNTTEGALASAASENANEERSVAIASNPSNTSTSTSGTHRIRLVPHLEATRSLHFEPIERDLVEGSIAVKIGRFTDRSMASTATTTTTASGQVTTSASANANMTRSETETNFLTAQLSSNAAPTASNAVTTLAPSIGVPGARGGAILSSAGGGGRVDSGRIAFKSKVVSRGHAEVWCEGGGKFFIRDTKSSSGTFLNHIRLSHPNVESKPFPLKDGDVVQLGVDYQGGTEEIYRCVKMRVELNRGWQRGANQFNVNALRQLRALQGTPLPDPKTAATTSTSILPTNRQSMNVTDCCICLFSVTVCQALFIAPCSHVFHFKCIRPLIEQHHPGFSCPLCRTFADLDADVEEDEAWQQALLKEAQLGDGKVNTEALDVNTPMAEEPSLNFSSVGLPLTAGSSSQSFGIRTNMENAVSDREASSRRESLLRRAVLGPHTGDESEGSSSHDRHQSTEKPDTSPNSLDNINQGTSIEPASQSISNERPYNGSYQSPSAFHQDRRPSAPISIRRSQGATTQTLPTRSPIEGFAMSPSFLDARTPQNEHFLSTLAEAPPPSRVAIRSIDLSVGDNTLFPSSSLTEQRRVSNATNNSSHHGTNEAFTTPAQGNSPPTDISPLSAFSRTQRVSDDNVEVNTAHSSTALHTKAKVPDAGMQNALDFLSGNNGTFGGSAQQSTAISPRRARETSAVGSIGSSDRGSSESRSQGSREGMASGGKVARFFKRNSTALNN